MRHPLALAVAVTVLTACGQAEDVPASQTGTEAASPPTAATQSSAGNPCAILTQAEMGEVLGTAVTRQEEPTSTRCLYYTNNPVIFVDLEIDRRNAEASWEGVNQGNSMIDAPQDTLADIGDQAFFGPRDRLYVLRGNTFMAVEAGFDDKVRERAKRVAELALRKVQ